MGDASARFERLEPLGEGAMGVVWRAWDRRYGCEVALKTLRIPAPEAVERLKHEFRRASELAHPNLVAMHDLVVGDRDAFFTMELVRGRSLDAGPFGPQEIRDLVIQLLSGLSALHAAGLLHRDVKPSNVLVEVDGRAVLLDFGLVLPEREAARAEVAGTLEYLAPELLQGGDPTAASDLFALGRVLTELLERAGTPDDEPLASLARRFCDPDPAARPTAEQALETLGAGAARRITGESAPLVGRDAERALLLGWLEPGAVVRVEGPSGIGKTALLQAVSAEHTLVRCRCHPAEVVPFNAFDDLLQTLAGRLVGRSTPALERALTPVAAVFPGTRSLLHPGAGAGVEPSLRAVALGLGAALEHLVGPEGGLWIDDAQWLGEDSRRLLAAFVELSPRAPVVLSHRPMAEDAPLAAEPWFVQARRMVVAPLSPEACAELARSVAGDDAPALVAAAQGNPLLVHRLAPRLREAGGAPVGLADALDGELRALGEPAAGLMRLVAVQEGPVPIEVLTGAHGGGPALQSALARLTHHRLLAFVSTRELNVAHDALRQVVLDGADPDARADAHRALARGYRQAAPDDHASIARHLWESGERASVRDVAIAAAADAERIHAWSRAARFYRMAVDAGPDVPDALRRDLARTLAAAGRAREAAHELLRIGAPDDRRRAAELLVACGAFGEGHAALAGVMALHGLRLPRTGLEAILRGLWSTLRARWVGLSPPPDPSAGPAADVLWTVAGVLGQHDTARTFALQGDHLRLSLATGDPARATRALAVEASYAEGSGASASWIAALDQRMDSLAAGADDDTRGTVASTRGYRDFMAGRLDAALAHFDEAEALFARSGAVRFERTLGWTHRVHALVQRGDLPAVRESWSDLRRRFTDIDDRAGLAGMEQGAGALLALADDDPDEATRRLDRAMGLLPEPLPPGFHYLDLLARVQVDQYRDDRAAAFARVGARWWSLAAFQLYRTPRVTLRWLWARTGADAGALSARRVDATARRLRAEGLAYGEVFGADLAVRAARLRGDRTQERERTAALISVAEQAGMGLHVAGGRLALARLDGDEAAAAQVIDPLRDQGVRRPEAFLRPFGA